MVGLIYDVHGNLEALEAVLADADAAGIGRFVLGGDYALFGLRPTETVERLRSLDARWIRGNVDRWTAHVHDAPDHPLVREAIEDCRAELGDLVVAELGELPEWLADEGRVRFSHGSPVSDEAVAQSLSRRPRPRSLRWLSRATHEPPRREPLRA